MPKLDKEVEEVMKKAMQLMANVEEATKDTPHDPGVMAMRRSTASLVTNLGMALEIAKREAAPDSD